MNLSQFAQWISNIGQNVDPATTEVVKEIVKDVGRTLVYSTPVDTGRARANWQGAVGSLPTGILYYPHPLAPVSPVDGAAEALTSIDNAASAYRGTGYVAIVNNVPYIEALNNGYSHQAPAGFVELAVVVGINALNGKSIVVP